MRLDTGGGDLPGVLGLGLLLLLGGAVLLLESVDAQLSTLRPEWWEEAYAAALGLGGYAAALAGLGFLVHGLLLALAGPRARDR